MLVLKVISCFIDTGDSKLTWYKRVMGLMRKLTFQFDAGWDV